MLDFSEEGCEIAPVVFKDFKKKEKLGVVVGSRDPSRCRILSGQSARFSDTPSRKPASKRRPRYSE